MTLLEKVTKVIDNASSDSSAKGESMQEWLEALEEVQEYLSESIDCVKSEL